MGTDDQGDDELLVRRETGGFDDPFDVRRVTVVIADDLRHGPVLGTIAFTLGPVEQGGQPRLTVLGQRGEWGAARKN
jgi:hypothetical protein